MGLGTAAMAVCMNSCLMDMCKHMLWYPMGGGWFAAEIQAVASMIDLQAYWLGLLRPHAVGSTARVLDDPEPTYEEVDEAIDIAASIFEEEILA